MRPRKIVGCSVPVAGVPDERMIASKNDGSSLCRSGGHGLPGLQDATSGLQTMWGDGGDGAMVRWQEPTDDHVPLVFGDMGQEVELEGEVGLISARLGTACAVRWSTRSSGVWRIGI